MKYFLCGTFKLFVFLETFRFQTKRHWAVKIRPQTSEPKWNICTRTWFRIQLKNPPLFSGITLIDSGLAPRQTKRSFSFSELHRGRRLLTALNMAAHCVRDSQLSGTHTHRGLFVNLCFALNKTQVKSNQSASYWGGRFHFYLVYQFWVYKIHINYRNMRYAFIKEPKRIHFPKCQWNISRKWANQS